MDKFSVVLDEDKVKTGSTKSSCPSCGMALDVKPGEIPICPNCGTEPWEKRPAVK